jgi:hypothetical protein
VHARAATRRLPQQRDRPHHGMAGRARDPHGADAMRHAPRAHHARIRRAALAIGVLACAGVSGLGAGQPDEASPSDPYSLLEPAPSVPTVEGRLRAEEEDLIEARVLLRTGRELVGLLVAEGEREATLQVRGEDMVIDLADSIEFEVLGPVLESYRVLRAATPDEDTQGRLMLARWLRDRGAYFAALDEVGSVVQAEPFNTEAAELGVWLREQVRLRVRAAERAEGGSEPERPERVMPRRRIQDFPVLTPEEINLIRVFEVDFADPPRLHVPRSAVEEFVDLYRDHEVMPRTPEGREALLRRDSLTILDLMFRAQARDLYGEVRVMEDPKAMRLFRSQIHKTWLVGSNSSCASTSCHGGQEAGRLYLNNHRANSDATVYTNFLILERFRLPDGTPLIDHEQPAESPLLQMALPRERSSRPHPDVGQTAGRRGWRPFFRDQDDMRFRRAVDWINALYNPRPDYPIDYTPPVPRGVRRLDDLPPPGER